MSTCKLAYNYLVINNMVDTMVKTVWKICHKTINNQPVLF